MKESTKIKWQIVGIVTQMVFCLVGAYMFISGMCAVKNLDPGLSQALFGLFTIVTWAGIK